MNVGLINRCNYSASANDTMFRPAYSFSPVLHFINKHKVRMRVMCLRFVKSRFLDLVHGERN